MKSIVALLSFLTLFSFDTFAQDSPQWHLPEGVTVRLGKGGIREIAYSPDGTRLAVASSIGIWLYDTATHQAVGLLTGHSSAVLYQINVIVLELFFTICYHAPMKNSNQVDPHFSVEKLKDRYLNCEHPKERTHWHIIWLLAQTDIPRTPREVAAIVGCSPDCVRKLRRRYNAHGEDALIDKRKTNGGKRCLDESQQQQLEIALSNPPPDGGLWTGPKVASWISEQIGRPVSTVTGWKYIKRLGFTLQTPRPRHQAAASPEAQAEVKKK